MPDGQIPEADRVNRIPLLRKIIHDRVRQPDFSFVAQNPHGHAGKTLAHGIGRVPDSGAVRGISALVDHLSVPEDHQLVNMDRFCLPEIPHETGDPSGWNALPLGCGALQRRIILHGEVKSRLLRPVADLSDVSCPSAYDIQEQFQKGDISCQIHEFILSCSLSYFFSAVFFRAVFFLVPGADSSYRNGFG